MKIRIIIIAGSIIAFILLFSLAYCTAPTDSEVAESLAMQLIDNIINEDNNSIKEMFCQKSRESETLDEEIDKLFDIITSDIDSYEDISCNSGETYSKGVLTRQQITVFINEAKTSNDTYNIVFFVLNVNADDESLVGISEIDIYDSDTGFLCCKIGELVLE